MSRTILLSGATGFLGAALAEQLRGRGVRVIALTRQARTPEQIQWDPLATSADAAVRSAIAQCDAVIHLAGENIAGGRWTQQRKKRIWESRIVSTRQLATAINSAAKTPEVFLCASGIGYYGNRGDEWLDEGSSPGSDWLSQLAQTWEAEARGANCRVVNLRFGVVLGKTGGALPLMLRPFYFGVGGRIGSGQQWLSWITRDDAVRAICHAIDQPISGPVNVCTDEPVRNADFAKVVGKQLHRPTFLRTPASLLRLALGEMADQLLLTSQRARPGVLIESGFQFRQRTIESALRTMLSG